MSNDVNMVFSSRIKLIIDCDPGTDDLQAILMALAHNDMVDLVAVSTVFGNSTVENTARNALRILKFAHRSDIPVYKGCSEAADGLPYCADDFHGSDALGDVIIDGVDPIDMSLIQDESAAAGLAKLVSEQPGEITLLAIGPLTNIAATLSIDKEFGTKLKNMVIMGGNFIDGSITCTDEFNFSTDKQAAYTVLHHLCRQIVLLPAETCCKCYLPWEVYDELSSWPTRTAMLIRSINAKLVSKLRSGKIEGLGNKYPVWDQLAMAVLIHPNCVIEENTLTSLGNFRKVSKSEFELSESNSFSNSSTTSNAAGVNKGSQSLDTKISSTTEISSASNNIGSCEIKVVTAIDDCIFLEMLRKTFNYEFSA